MNNFKRLTHRELKPFGQTWTVAPAGEDPNAHRTIVKGRLVGATMLRRRSGRIGRRAGLKIRFPSGSVGSSPTFGTDGCAAQSYERCPDPGRPSSAARPRHRVRFVERRRLGCTRDGTVLTRSVARR